MNLSAFGATFVCSHSPLISVVIFAIQEQMNYLSGALCAKPLPMRKIILL